MLIIVLLLLVASVLCGIGARLIADDFLSPLALFTYFAVVIFIIRPLFLISGLVEFYAPLLLKEDLDLLIVKGTAIFLCGYFSVLVGYLSSKSVGNTIAATLPTFNKNPNNTLLILVLIFALLCSLFLFLAALKQYGNIGGVIFAARTGIWQGNQLSALINQNASALAAIAFADARIKNRTKRSYFYLFLLLINLCLTALFGDRSGIVLPFIALMIAYHYYGRLRISTAKFGAIMVTVLIISSLLSGLRGDLMFESRRGGIHAEEISQVKNIAKKVSSGGNLQSYDYYLIIIQDSISTEMLGGEHFWKGVIAIVPRSIWSSKPEIISTAAWFTEHFYGAASKQGGKPFTNIGAWYVNFSWLGVFFGMLLSGVALRILNDWRRRTKSFWSRYYIAWITLLVFLSGLTPAFPTQVIKWAIPLYAAYLLVTIGRKSTSFQGGVSSSPVQ